jgi:hypothetical protein
MERNFSGSLSRTSKTFSPNSCHISVAVEGPIPLIAPDPRNVSICTRPSARRGTIDSAVN